MDPITWGLLIFLTAIALILAGIPIWVALAGTGILFSFITAPLATELLPNVLFENLNDTNLLTIPLFIIIAEAISQTRASEAIFDAMEKWFAWLAGHLGISNLLAAGFMGIITGSGPACAAAIGGIGIPRMKKMGYPIAFAGALVAAGSTVDILIGPGIPKIIYAIATEQSIGRMIAAGIIPGALLIGVWSAFVSFYYKFSIGKRLKQELAVAQPIGEGGDVEAAMLPMERVTWGDRWRSLPKVIPFAILAIAILGSIFTGTASPAEAAAIGALVSLILAAAMFQGYKPATLKKIFGISINESSMILIIIAASMVFGFALSNVYAPQAMAEWLATLPLGKWGIFIIINLFVLLLGMFVPPVAAILLVGPFLVDVLVQLGFDAIWYGIIMTLLLQISLLAPTTGLNMLIVKRLIPEVPIGTIFKASIPFILAIFLVILILIIFPQIVTFLPDLMFGPSIPIH